MPLRLILQRNMNFKIFEIYDDKNRKVNTIQHIQCLPPKEHIDSMFQHGYKFKLDGKNMAKKAVYEFIKNRRAKNEDKD